MNTRVPEPHSFVVKIWAEEVRDPSQDAAWRGSVTHVGTGERRYLENLPQIVTFIAPYVQQTGASLDLTTRLLAWWWSFEQSGLSSPDRPPDDAQRSEDPT